MGSEARGYQSMVDYVDRVHRAETRIPHDDPRWETGMRADFRASERRRLAAIAAVIDALEAHGACDIDEYGALLRRSATCQLWASRGGHVTQEARIA